ncbi:hypothetical protein [Streptomyces sp. NPDC046942]|uniref:hypothetical protein n=1 Tax=Streptomyces sp. NPDC046942 TaxID=3155137 RepID=UPI00340D2DC8
MEQRTGASSKPSKAEPLKTEPVTGAGFDPAFIPGITAPAKADTNADTDASTAAGSEAVEPEPEVQDAKVTAPPEEAGEAGEAGEADESTDDSGPVFEASDRRAKIVADRKGLRLSLDAESCEFRWDEVAAVETETPRFGKRYTITVHTPDRRWYPIEIEAASKSRFSEWDEQLDAVLDAYFEDESEAEESA